MHSRRRAGLALFAAFALAASWSGVAVPAARAIVVDPLTITPNPVEFGTVAWGNPATTDVTITNISGGSVTIDSDSISLNPTEYAIAGGTCSMPQSLAAAASCTVTVQFSPITSGSTTTGTLHLASASAGDHDVTLHGTGTDPIAQGAGLAFGSQAEAATSASLVATITNNGSVSINPASATISGTNAADFAKVLGQDTCTGQLIAPAASCSVAVTFHPLGLGARTATLTIAGPLPIGERIFALTGTGIPPVSSVVWGTTRAAGPNFTWNDGWSLGRTVKSRVQQLHLIYETDVIGGKFVTNKGPYLGVYYIHSTTGSSWTAPFRLNPAKQNGARRALAASGSYVYTVWVSETSWVNYNPAKPRVLYVRVNSNHGASSAWKAPKALTSSTGRVDWPIIAASGAYVHIVWTDAKTGAIRIATSSNHGTTWRISTIGTTTYVASNGDGREGVPVVSVSGAYIVVAWAANQSDKLVARVSSNHGSTWSSTATIANTSYGAFAATNLGSRAAITWIDGNGVNVRVKTSSSWAATRVVAPYNGDVQYSPAIALQSSNRLAVTWATFATTDMTSLMWAESPNNGVAFYQPQTLFDTNTASHTANDYPSVQWPSLSTRIVVWNGYNSAYTSYRLFVRIGTGTPTGLALVAPLASTFARPAIAGPSFHRADRIAVR